MFNGVTDVPVQEINNDKFEIKKYVVGLSEFIENCDTPMTISIQGDWGSGKTSMMNMLKGIIETHKVQTIWFNTWQFSQFSLDNNLVFAMLNILINELSEKDNATKANIKSIMTRVAKAAVTAGVSMATGGAVNVKEAIDSVAEQVVDTNYAQEIMKLKECFENLVENRLAALGKDRVVVFVDDLDRLQPGKAVELLEVLKLFLDCKKCVFVLAVDYEIVTLGVKEKYGNSVTEDKGRSFFDKIIQLPFKMPVSNYDIKKYVQETLASMQMPVDEKSCIKFVNLIGTSIGYNPRAMKRLFNTYQLLDNICKKEDNYKENKEARERILFGTICMQMKYEGLYKYFAKKLSVVSSEMLADFADDKNLDTIKEDHEFMELLEKSSIDLDERLKGMTRFMKCFNDVVDIDGNHKIDDNELDIMREVFKISRITSVGEAEEEGHSSVDWQWRTTMQNITKAISEKYSLQMKGLRVVKTRSKNSFKEGQLKLDFSIGELKCCLGFYIWPTEDSQGEASIELQNCSGQKNSNRMEEIFGKGTDNPLGIDGYHNQTEYGTFQYLYPQIDVSANNLDKVAETLGRLYFTAYNNLLLKFPELNK